VILTKCQIHPIAFRGHLTCTDGFDVTGTYNNFHDRMPPNIRNFMNLAPNALIVKGNKFRTYSQLKLAA
jgi:hypothetical protein